MTQFSDLRGTTFSNFTVGIRGATITNLGGSAFSLRSSNYNVLANLEIGELYASGNNLYLNADADNSANNFRYVISVPATGMTEQLTLTLPTTKGAAGQVLQTNGSGVLSWVDLGSIGSGKASVNFNSASAIPVVTVPQGKSIDKVDVIIDTPWVNTTTAATLTMLGVFSSSDIDLQAAAGTVFSYHPGSANAGSGGTSISLIYVQNTATAGSARVKVFFS